MSHRDAQEERPCIQVVQDRQQRVEVVDADLIREMKFQSTEVGRGRGECVHGSDLITDFGNFARGTPRRPPNKALR
jgi:hypothetical protein